MKAEGIIPKHHSKNISVRKLFLKRLEMVVDLGCGEGKPLKLLEERFKNIKIFGIDIEPSMIKIENFLNGT